MIVAPGWPRLVDTPQTSKPDAAADADASSHESLLRRVAELTELAGGLAHELRNPLSTLMVNLKLLGEDLRDFQARPEDTRRRALLKIEVLRREAERLQSLFDEFLRLAGTWSIHVAPVDLRQLVERLIEFLEPLLHGHKIEVRLDSPPESIVCLADEKLISQALLNIALNAQQAMPDGGAMTIRIGKDADGASISIRDTGVGIPEADRERIMRPFFSTKAGGSGLGLPLCKRIVEEHGGTLSFASELGKGTNFTIRLPAAP